MLHRSFPSGMVLLSTIMLFLGGVMPGGRLWSVETSEKVRADEIAELRKEIAALREENRKLRQLLIEKVDDNIIAGAPRAKVVPVPSAADVAAASDRKGTNSQRFWLSTGGKRHNSRCRYFKGAGRACDKDEGVPCKVCGG